MIKRLLLISVLFTTPNLVTAAVHVSTISHIYPHSDTQNGDFIIMFHSDSGSSCASSTNPKYYYVAVGQNGVTKESLNKMYAAALAAAASRQTVRVNFDANSPQCWISSLWVEF